MWHPAAHPVSLIHYSVSPTWYAYAPQNIHTHVLLHPYTLDRNHLLPSVKMFEPDKKPDGSHGGMLWVFDLTRLRERLHVLMTVTQTGNIKCF